MKHVLKSLFALLIVTGLFAACSNEDDEKVYGPAGFKTFGFFAADNEGILFQDYVVEDSTSAALTVYLPKEVDKTALVARFLTTPDDIVTVNGVEQVSGETVNDFSAPVDYYVTEGTNNVRITVTVTTAPAYVWSTLPAFADDSITGLVMKVNPTNGQPYIVFKQDRVASADEKAAVITFANNTWAQVGDAGVSEGQVGSYFDIAFNNAGQPAILYADYTATISQQSSAKVFDGQQWAYLGNKGFTADKVSYTGLAFAPKASWMAFSMFDGRNGPLARRALNWSNFANNTWTSNLSIPGRAETLNAYLPRTKVVGDSLYLGIFNAGTTPQTVSIYKYVDGVWTVLADQYLPEGATNINLRDLDIDVTKDGKVMVLTGANSAEDADTYKLTLTSFNPATQTWALVGSPLNVDLGSVRYMDLALSPYDVPFVAYKDATGYASVVEFDTEAMQWGEAVVLEAKTIDDIYLDFAPNGVGYVATDADGRIQLYTFDKPSN